MLFVWNFEDTRHFWMKDTNLFLDIIGDEDTIMGLPIKKIKEYLNNYK